ncbi:methyl-accepting chemotaxis protein [Halorientalis pallida]|uniref:methyl-accepting chemotaxis protein n=1 Tax=Halorientalis pallida TaxID=2479928 RepID=UPI003C6F8058
MTGRATDIADPERRALVNARGALKVVRTASVSVDDGLGDIDDRMATQAEEMRSVLADVSDLSATIEEMAASSQEIDERTTRAAEAASEGRAAAGAAMERMESVRETGVAAAEEMQRLQQRIDSIESALGNIDDIAEQTNILALNASIEAARTDGDSDGFAVVADEIKGLAAESQQLSDDIATTLTEVREATDATVSSLDEAVDEITASARQIERAADSLADVAETVETTSEDVAAMSATTDEQARVSESVADRCERAAERTDAIEEELATIREARTEQTAMLGEISEAIGDAVPPLAPDTVETVPTGIPELDERVDGLVRGGRIVLRYDVGPVADLVAGLCSAALDTGLAVSLTPPPGLDEATLAESLERQPRTALESDRLFVLDAFDDWRSRRNVFDLSSSSLSTVNERTVRRRDAPLLVVGNVAAEIRTLGEQRAREARYENDAGVFDARDTVLNVVDDGTVDDTFGAFYAGAADQVFELSRSAGERRLHVRTSPTGRDGAAVSLPGVDTVRS